jgi:hypothetical protein
LTGPFVHSEAGEQGKAAADMPSLESELAGIHAYYQALIGAARKWLSPDDAAALVRRLQDEQMLVLRNAKDRHHTAQDNQRKILNPFVTSSKTAYPGHAPG